MAFPGYSFLHFLGRLSGGLPACEQQMMIAIELSSRNCLTYVGSVRIMYCIQKIPGTYHSSQREVENKSNCLVCEERLRGRESCGWFT